MVLYKSTLTRNCNNNIKWQPRFHDHIIRNQNEYNRIVKYIADNVSKLKGM